jgi:hypothetical protein
VTLFEWKENRSRQPVQRPFESAAWLDPKSKDAAGRFCSLRQAMTDDLLATHLPQGSSRAALLEHLGPPARWHPFDTDASFGVEFGRVLREAPRAR